MVRNLTRNQAPGNRLRVRIPCPPLQNNAFPCEYRTSREFLGTSVAPMQLGAWRLRRCFSRRAPKSSRFSRRARRQNTGVLHVRHRRFERSRGTGIRTSDATGVVSVSFDNHSQLGENLRYPA